MFSTSNTVVPIRPTSEDGKSSNEEVFLPGDPTDLISQGKFNDVPCIMGINSREALLYVQGKKLGIN